MEAPDKIYLYGDATHSEPNQRYGYEPRTGKYRGWSILSVPYIREDVVAETIQTAEDHAYFAGKEKLREELLEKLSLAYDTACSNVYDGPDVIKDLIESLKSM